MFNPQMEPVDFQLEKGNALRVRVVDKDGKPIPGVFVTPDTWRGKRVLCDLGDPRQNRRRGALELGPGPPRTPC